MADEEDVDSLDFPSGNPQITTDEEGEVSDDLLFDEGDMENDSLFSGNSEVDEY